MDIIFLQDFKRFAWLDEIVLFAFIASCLFLGVCWYVHFTVQVLKSEDSLQEGPLPPPLLSPPPGGSRGQA